MLRYIIAYTAMKDFHQPIWCHSFVVSRFIPPLFYIIFSSTDLIESVYWLQLHIKKERRPRRGSDQLLTSTKPFCYVAVISLLLWVASSPVFSWFSLIQFSGKICVQLPNDFTLWLSFPGVVQLPSSELQVSIPCIVIKNYVSWLTGI